MLNLLGVDTPDTVDGQYVGEGAVPSYVLHHSKLPLQHANLCLPPPKHLVLSCFGQHLSIHTSKPSLGYSKHADLCLLLASAPNYLLNNTWHQTQKQTLIFTPAACESLLLPPSPMHPMFSSRGTIPGTKHTSTPSTVPLQCVKLCLLSLKSFLYWASTRAHTKLQPPHFIFHPSKLKRQFLSYHPSPLFSSVFF